MSFLNKNIYFSGRGFAEKLAMNQKVHGYSCNAREGDSSGIIWKYVTEIEFRELLSRGNIKKEAAKSGLFMVVMKNFGFWKTLKDKIDFSQLQNVLVLDRIQDTHNFGAICRTARWAGIDMVCIPHKGNAPVGEGALVASSGYMLNLKIIAGKLTDIVRKFSETGYEIAGSVVTNGKSLEACSEGLKGKKKVIIMGNERRGLTRELEKMCSKKLTIPMKNNVDSLNVSVATGIILYQVMKNEETTR